MKNKMLSFFKITFVLSTILLISSSCTKDKWYSDTDIYNAEFEIFSNDWIFDSSDRSYYYDFKDGDLMIPNVVNNGAVQATVLIDGTYRPLPYTNYFIENGIEYAETLNFEYNTGYIRFNVIATDQFYDATTKPRTYKIKVTTISYY